METQNIGAVDSQVINDQLDIGKIANWLHQDCIKYWREKDKKNPGMDQSLHGAEAHLGKAELIWQLSQAIKEHEAISMNGGDPEIEPFDDDVVDEARSILSTDRGRLLMLIPKELR